jgi:cell pole-organizing protein PopZ
MEELLASIRKAIHEDIGEVPSVGQGDERASPAIRGTMGEMRVRVTDEGSGAAAEIQELRDKISRGRTAERPREIPAAAAPGYVRAPLFSDPLPQPGERPRYGQPPVLRAIPTEDTPSFRYETPRPLRRETEPAQPAPRTWRDEDVAPPPSPPPRITSEASILSAEASAAAQQAFGRLADTFLNRALGDRSIEDMARDMLRQMLKQWLDENLPALVERLVREEIERVARNGR